MKLVLSIVIVNMFFIGNFQEKSKLIIDFELENYKKGKLFVAIYNSEESFLKEAMSGRIMEIKNGKATVIFDSLDYGTYAISSFLDKNDNGILDTNFFGIPKEPTAMSNNAKAKFGPPKFKDAKFNFTSNNNIIKIKF